MDIDNNGIIMSIREMYRLIMVVDEETRQCEYVDYDMEVMNLPYEPNDFDRFCQELRENIHPADREEFYEFSDAERVKNALVSKPYVTIECRLKLYDKQYYWSEITFCRANSASAAADFLLLIRDVNDRKLRELAEIRDILRINAIIQEEYDDLFEENMKDVQTGCYNRKGLAYYSQKVLEEAKSKDLAMFVCVLDLNGLKHINDTFGHKEGDIAIAAIAAEIQKSLPEGAVSVRTGGDEFLVFGSMDEKSDAPIKMCDAMDTGLEEFNKAHDYPFEVAVSYGWVLLPVNDGMKDFDEYIELADSKMYEMKKEKDKYMR